jgi:hypothetical protein
VIKAAKGYQYLQTRNLTLTLNLLRPLAPLTWHCLTWVGQQLADWMPSGAEHCFTTSSIVGPRPSAGMAPGQGRER